MRQLFQTQRLCTEHELEVCDLWIKALQDFRAMVVANAEGRTQDAENFSLDTGRSLVALDFKMNVDWIEMIVPLAMGNPSNPTRGGYTMALMLRWWREDQLQAYYDAQHWPDRMRLMYEAPVLYEPISVSEERDEVDE